LNKASNGRYAQQWSFLSGPWETNGTWIFIGGPAYSYMQNGYTTNYGVHWYNLQSTSTWTISLSSITLGSSSSNILGNSNFPNAHFNVELDSILLPPSVYNQVESSISMLTSELICGSDVYSGCYYPDVCGNLFGPTSGNPAPKNIIFNFGD